jgi:hypothetical protein
MAQILEMMQQHGEKFGDTNESELEEQLKMYNV